MTVDFSTEGPGKLSGYKYDWDDILPKLKSRPGKWGTISAIGAAENYKATMATAQRLKNGVVKGTYPNEFEATVRRTVLYARYVGRNREFAGNDE